MPIGDESIGGKGTRTAGWHDRVQGVVERAEDGLGAELRTLIAYLNDEVVPDVRRNGSEALRAAAAELDKLAERMDDQRTGRGTGAHSKP